MEERWTPVVRALRKRFSRDADAGELEAYLSEQGYDQGQIGEILSLLAGDTVTPSNKSARLVSRAIPFRVQGPHERGRFTSEAWGYLMTLSGSSSVNINDFEQLVERALVHVDGRIGLPEIRAIAEDGGFDDVGVGSDRTQVH